MQKTYLEPDDIKFSVHEVSLEHNFQPNDYVFILGFNQGSIPRVYQDIDYLNNKELEEAHLTPIILKQQLENKRIKNLLNSLPNVSISYKLADEEQNYTVSNLISDLDVNIIKDLKPTFKHSNLYNQILLNSLKDEFNNIKVGFKKAVEEETKSQNMKNELISNVSHDLKTPLTCIKNYIVLLQDDTLSSNTRQEYINSLNQYVNRLTSLIEDLFEVSKANSGNIKLNLINLNIVALLEQTFTENKEVLESKNLTTIKNYANNEIKLNLDGDKTYRIFENLFTNISKYAMANSRVYLEIKETDDEVIIEFKNISATQMNFSAEEIVERFVRGDKSRHEAGSGLGLAIAKSFTEIQNGKFEIEIDGDLFKVIITFKK